MPKKIKRYGKKHTVRFSTIYEGKNAQIRICTCPFCMTTIVNVYNKYRKRHGIYNKCKHYDDSKYTIGYGFHGVFYEKYKDTKK
jgi:hypothetical protein